MRFKNLYLGIVLLIGVLLIMSTVMASYSRSNPQYTSPGASSIGFNYGAGVEIFPGFKDNQECGLGQDFIVQIAPFGCTPAVVTSDLLEEQNVPVFCQLMATKVNPLIDVDAINYINFQGQYPKEVSGVGFHPAKAAISGSQKTLLNSPVMENIGYATIVLKQQKKESEMPDFVEGTLVANIKYDVEKAFGVGAASYYLPELSASDWSLKYNQYGFWSGRGFLRSEGVTENGAAISIYVDDDKKFRTVNLKKGETSENIYLPNYDCNAALRIRLDGLENPDTRVKLNINGDIVELADGEKFLDNKCSITNIDTKGLIQLVNFNCETDETNFVREDYVLSISPKVELSINGETKSYEVGDKMPFSDDPNKAAYLGFVNTRGNSGRIEDLYVRFVQMPGHADKLDANILGEIARFDRADVNQQKGSLINQGVSAVVKTTGSLLERFTKYLIKGTEITENIEINKEDEVYGAKIILNGFTDLGNNNLNEDVKENYENAIKDYRMIVSGFSGEEFQSDFTFGEESLQKLILMSENLGQKEDFVKLCKEFREKYPFSKNTMSICDNDLKLANDAIDSISLTSNGKIKTISFDGVYQPSLSELSVEIELSNSGKLGKDRIIGLNEQIYVSDNEYFELLDLNNGYATFDFNGISQGALREAGWKTVDQRINLGEYFVVGENKYKIKVNKINLEKVAKVSILPVIDNQGTQANFSYKIGIEKRAIQLSPGQAQNMVKELDEMISQWEDVSSALGTVVKGFKGACLGIGTMLTVKNLFTNFDGKSMARSEVMRSNGGWMDICKNEISEKSANGEDQSLDGCLLEHAEEIDRDVERVYGIMNDQTIITQDNLEEDLKKLNGELDDEFVSPYNSGDKIENKNDFAAAFSQNGFDKGVISLSQARDLDRLNKIIKNTDTSEELKSMSEVSRWKILSEINSNAEGLASEAEAKRKIESLGLAGSSVFRSYKGGNKQKELYDGTVTQRNIGDIKEGDEIQAVDIDNGLYFVGLNPKGDNMYYIDRVYDSDGYFVEKEEELRIKGLYSEFEKYSEIYYKNTIEIVDRKVRYYETAPYKGLPAVVPFDISDGWYAATKQTLPVFGGVRSYDESGRINSFYLCNVGQNGKIDFLSGITPDNCRSFTPGGQMYGEFYGLSEKETGRLVNKAMDAIEIASRAYGEKSVKIDAHSLQVGKPQADVPEVMCQDFMSPTDCLLLFNACDPVICPSSRCNFGGAYHVSNVVQSGIIGSIALCLPNIKEKIFVPVCLTGVKAGIDGLLSVFKNYQKCLEHNIETGETIGICDEIHSIYLCEFFWGQALPFTKMIIPKMFELLSGQGTRGGGEYLGVQDAWDNADKSVDYMTQYYGAESYKAFNARLTDDVGTTACKGFVSARYPTSGNFFEALLEPDSPSQHHAWFSESTYTTATVPPVSKYKVFYHIFAGNDQGAYYKVYLKSPTGGSFYKDTERVEVDSGYIGKGDFASETKDFTAPSGYAKLCISVNAKEDCGYKQVSTSFASEYIKDEYMKSQIESGDIKSESECISGSASAFSLLSPNVQAGVEEMLDPNIRSRGIVRVCSTNNPGQSFDVDSKTGLAKWEIVGTCGEKGGLKCWLNTDSIDDAIEGSGARESAEKSVAGSTVDALRGEGAFIADFEKEKERLSKLSNDEKILEINDELILKVFYNNEKVQLYYLRARAYDELAVEGYRVQVIEEVLMALSQGIKEVSEQVSDGTKFKCKIEKEEIDNIIKGIGEVKRFQNIYGITKDGRSIPMCARYARYAATYYFCKKYISVDAWCNGVKNIIIHEFPDKSKDNNDKLKEFEKEGVLKPGMIVGVYYPYSSYNPGGENNLDGDKTCSDGKTKIKMTHNLLYLGKNLADELIFVESFQGEDKGPTRRTLSEFSNSKFITMGIYDASETILNKDLAEEIRKLDKELDNNLDEVKSDINPVSKDDIPTKDSIEDPVSSNSNSNTGEFEKCSDCGEGVFERCDESECKKIGESLGSGCYSYNSYAGPIPIMTNCESCLGIVSCSDYKFFSSNKLANGESCKNNLCGIDGGCVWDAGINKCENEEENIMEVVDWTYVTAYNKINEYLKKIGNVKYSENSGVKFFIDTLCSQKLLTQAQCIDVKGGTFTNWEENLEKVKILLFKNNINKPKY